MKTQCPFCGSSNPQLHLDGDRFFYACCDELDREAEKADEETVPFHYLTTSDTPRAALGKWQAMCSAMTATCVVSKPSIPKP